MIDILPNNLEEAIDILINFFRLNDLKEIEKFKNDFKDEDHFLSHVHHTAGQFIRNNWFLWWYENHEYSDWPKAKPNIIKYFNDLGIYHADDMSGIILTSLYRKIFNQDLKIEEQVQFYKNYWSNNSF